MYGSESMRSWERDMMDRGQELVVVESLSSRGRPAAF